MLWPCIQDRLILLWPCVAHMSATYAFSALSILYIQDSWIKDPLYVESIDDIIPVLQSCCIKKPEDRYNLTPLPHTMSIWELHNKCESGLRLSPNIVLCSTAQKIIYLFCIQHWIISQSTFPEFTPRKCNCLWLTRADCFMSQWATQEFRGMVTCCRHKKDITLKKIVTCFWFFSEKKCWKTFLPLLAPSWWNFWPGFSRGLLQFGYCSAQSIPRTEVSPHPRPQVPCRS